MDKDLSRILPRAIWSKFAPCKEEDLQYVHGALQSNQRGCISVWTPVLASI